MHAAVCAAFTLIACATAWCRAAAAWPRRAALSGAALDVLGWCLDLRFAVSSRLSAAFTVRWDPLGGSQRPIPVGDGSPDTFTVAAACERDRRIVAWIYRTYESPDVEDWRASLARFGHAACPPHSLQLADGRELKVLELRVGQGGNPGRGYRTLLGVTADGVPGLRIGGPIPLGGLSPACMIKDAFRQSWSPTHPGLTSSQ
jgi:hypothetical protein